MGQKIFTKYRRDGFYADEENCTPLQSERYIDLENIHCHRCPPHHNGTMVIQDNPAWKILIQNRKNRRNT